MNAFGKLVIAGAAVILLLQLIHPSIPQGPATSEIQAPPQVRQILEKDCYSCHSNERRLSWFDEVAPGYWLVRHDILTARQHLNFSTIGSKPLAAQQAALYEAVNMIQLGAMPLSKFVLLHPDSRVTPEELTTLKAYLAPWSESGSTGIMASSPAAELPFRANLAGVPPEFNGLAFQPGFEDWKPISFTDRGDNNTFRFILGNEIAVRAMESGNISPWPDGTRFAKIAWQQTIGEDGLIYPGKFVQVEFMMKDAKLYKQDEGWGWGRWRGAALKPYGKDFGYVGECTGCHAPVHGNDFVYTLPITLARVNGDEVVNNKAAALPKSLPHQPLNWNAITMYVDPRSHTMATLYGNDVAMRTVKTRNNNSGEPMSDPLRGSVFALVTWAQRDDPHWFGARIPESPKSVEIVEADISGKPLAYRRYDGADLSEHPVAADIEAKQIRFILSLAPAWLP
jgi:hypothetical protein